MGLTPCAARNNPSLHPAGAPGDEAARAGAKAGLIAGSVSVELDAVVEDQAQVVGRGELVVLVDHRCAVTRSQPEPRQRLESRPPFEIEVPFMLDRRRTGGSAGPTVIVEDRRCDAVEAERREDI